MKIDQAIVSCSVVTAKPPEPAPVLRSRPEVLSGTTYKLKTPLSEHALYVTINNLEGRPFEIFVNCKDMGHFQWIVALTRVLSAVFRHGGDCAFLVDELMSVLDPKGGYFYKGQYRASLVAEIGSILQQHMTNLGLIVKDTSLADAAKVMLAEKRATAAEPRQCAKCHDFAVVMMSGCLTCTSCGDSKCS